MDLRTGAAEAVIGRRGARRSRGRPARTLPLAPEGRHLATGQGLDRLVRERLEALARGESLRIAYAIPSRLDTYDFRVRAVAGRKAGRSGSAWSSLRGPAPARAHLEVEYDRTTGRLLRYRGASNLADGSGNNPQVEITYAYPEPAARRGALGSLPTAWAPRAAPPGSPATCSASASSATFPAPTARDRWSLGGGLARPPRRDGGERGRVHGRARGAGGLGGRAPAPGARPARPRGTAALAAGALLNAAGTLTPAVLVLHVAPACADGACLPVARALLGVTLSLDALFNLVFGAGLALAAAALGRSERRPVVGALGVGAGLATIPVSLQIASDAAASWLAVAGPLWLAFVAATSLLLLRGRPDGRATSAAGAGGADAAVARSR